MMIATDGSGKVLLVGNSLPTEFNGAALTVHELTDQQQKAFDALTPDRSGTIFDGQAFTEIPAEPVVEVPSEFDIFKAVVSAKLNITDADLAQAETGLIAAKDGATAR